jgi:galactose mutarotase-like enzyme
MLHTLQHNHLSINVSSRWAELQSLKRGEQEFLYQKREGYWQRQSPHLFPIVGGLRDGRYEIDGDEYHLSQHGFARDREWELSQAWEDFLEFVLIADAHTLRVYPYDFLLFVRYTIHESSLYVEYRVVNPSDQHGLVASIGAHPAFAIDDISRYRLRLPHDTSLAVSRLDSGLLSLDREEIHLEDHILQLSDELFVRDALILLDMQSHRVDLLRDEEVVLTLDRGNLPYLALWRQVESPFLCIEPWQGHADRADRVSYDFSEKEWVFFLEPLESREFSWFVTL